MLNSPARIADLAQRIGPIDLSMAATSVAWDRYPVISHIASALTWLSDSRANFLAVVVFTQPE
ncbi:hypothetical protein [[Pantoea] beijingensis]|uniref:hypothetical protein n=1 Tax=[Pantoea] beijingensis TaxID=1324864 RepID=UPI000FE323D8|nr:MULTISPECIES: hypothetical protein [Erwiniaceae]